MDDEELTHVRARLAGKVAFITGAGGNGGSIVLTSSYAGKKMQPFMIHYTTSKHALVGMTRAFAAELASTAPGSTRSTTAVSRPRWAAGT